MILQGFLSCSGTPPAPLNNLLTELSLKISGWSRRMNIETSSFNNKKSSNTGLIQETEDRQASLRR